MHVESLGPIALATGVVILLAGGWLAARLISRLAGWQPAGPIALIAAAPLVPRVTLFFSLTADDLLPLLGLGLLVLSLPVPRLPRDRILRGILIAVAITTLARAATAMVNGGGLEGTILMLAKAVARPIVLLGIASYVAIAAPEGIRQRFVAISVASVGTFEAAFGLVAFLFRLPGGIGIEPARQLTSLYGTCVGRISGTLGLSPNHLGAVFVLSLPFTLSLAVTQAGWRRWAWALAAAGQTAALVLTFTRSSIVLGVLVILLFLLIQRRFVILAGVTVMAAVILGSALTFGCSSAPGSPGPTINPGAILGDRFSDGNDRLALWYSASRVMLDHPAFGVGLDKMTDAVKANPGRYAYTPFGVATSSAHNTILLAGAETGVVGALAIVGINIGIGLIALGCAWRGRKRESALLLAAGLAMGTYLVQGMFNNLFSVPATSSVFALTVGAFAASYRSVRAGPGTSRAPDESPRLDPYTSPASEASTPDGDH